jgi:hypothetical protein
MQSLVSTGIIARAVPGDSNAVDDLDATNPDEIEQGGDSDRVQERRVAQSGSGYAQRFAHLAQRCDARYGY